MVNLIGCKSLSLIPPYSSMFYSVLLAPLFIFLTLGFGIAHLKKDNSIADILWGLYFILLVAMALFFYAEPDSRQILSFVLVLIWGLRLSAHIFHRHWGKGEDPRYTEMKKNWKHVALRSYFQVFLLQGLLALLIVSPVLWVHMHASAGPLTWLDFLGLGVWVLGYLFEVIGDAQLGAFIKVKKPGEIMRTGLWKYTRHPNYFGEVTQWWGLFLIALSVPGAWVFFFGPLLITLLILFVSGVPLLERRYEGNPQWEDYKKRTSIFIPWFPKT